MHTAMSMGNRPRPREKPMGVPGLKQSGSAAIFTVLWTLQRLTLIGPAPCAPRREMLFSERRITH
jgi:hypothetical protein